jgi:RNA polymerase sigma-70 factor (ECF subfamily)
MNVNALEEQTAGSDDRALLEGIAKGQAEALHELYRRHRVRVFRFVLRFVRDTALAEDLTNDVFIELYRSADRFEHRSSVSTWLLGMARYKALSARRRDRSSETEVDDVLAGVADEADNPEIATQKRDKAAALRRCIERLGPEHREIVDLVYYHERSIREIAEIVGIPENTVKTRMFHARRRLSELLAAAGIDRGWP